MSKSKELPKYESHTEVYALKIKRITKVSFSGAAEIVPEEEGYSSFVVYPEYMEKHKPRAGGYYVVSKGGYYKSFSPASVFEAAYSKINQSPTSQLNKTMKTELGETGLKNTYQSNFPKETKCVQKGCEGNARIAFVAIEEEAPFVCDLHDNEGKQSENPEGEGYWLHDAGAYAVYLCGECLAPTALSNQA